jgi:hypothetical protein
LCRSFSRSNAALQRNFRRGERFGVTRQPNESKMRYPPSPLESLESLSQEIPAKIRLSKNLEIKIRETKDLGRDQAHWARCHDLGHDRANSISKARLDVTTRAVEKFFWSVPGRHRSHPFDFAKGTLCRREPEKESAPSVVDFAAPVEVKFPTLSQRTRQGWGTRLLSIGGFFRLVRGLRLRPEFFAV